MTAQDVEAAYAAKAQEVADLFTGGATVAEVARQLGMYPGKVRRFLAFKGIDMAQVRKDVLAAKRIARRDAANAKRVAAQAAARALIEETAERYMLGESTSELAKHYGVTREAIRQRIAKAGFEPADLREHLFSELEFLCGTDSFEGLCQRLGTTTKSVHALCMKWDRAELYRRLTKTRITDYTEDQNAA